MEDREAVTPRKKFPRRKVEKYFQKLQKNGTELYVDGEKVSPSQAAAYAVREESPYMADYISVSYTHLVGPSRKLSSPSYGV